MSIEAVRSYLSDFGLADRIIEFQQSSATVELAAQALGTEGARIAKSMTFLVDGNCVLVVMSGDRKADNAKFKAVFHTKCTMLSHDQALEMTGHGVGGICPFALPAAVQVYLDESLKRFDTVYPAAGSANSCVKLTPDELWQAVPGAVWIDVSKPVQPVG